LLAGGGHLSAAKLTASHSCLTGMHRVGFWYSYYQRFGNSSFIHMMIKKYEIERI